MAERFPEGPGQPAITGIVTEEAGNPNGVHGVIHCQALVELFGGESYPPGTFPGGIVVHPSESVAVGPPGKPCPAVIP